MTSSFVGGAPGVWLAVRSGFWRKLRAFSGPGFAVGFHTVMPLRTPTSLSARAFYPVDSTARKNIVSLSATIHLKSRWTAGWSIGNPRHRLRVAGKQNDNIIRLQLNWQQ
jgi:hypothetical protein